MQLYLSHEEELTAPLESGTILNKRKTLQTSQHLKERLCLLYDDPFMYFELLLQ
jgi:hypothetical protein